MSTQPNHPSRTRLATSLGLAALASLAVASLQAETVDTTNKTFSVDKGGRIEVDVDRGGIEVGGTSGSEVTIEIVRKVSAGSEQDEKDLLAADKIEITQDGNTVKIYARGPKDEGSGWLGLFGRGTRRNYQYKVKVPQQFNATLRTSGGGIDVWKLEGDVNTNTSGGGLHFEEIAGSIDGHTSGGGIKLRACKGTVKVHTSGGGIDARDGSGPLDLNTSGGGITIRVHTGDVRAHTSGGGITLEDIAGNLDADTSGGSISARLLACPTGDCRLSTSGGGITVKMPRNAAVTLDASTSAGGVHSEFPVTVTGEIKRDRLKGPINGGGPILRLRSSAGSVRLEQGPEAGPAPSAPATPLES